MGRFGAARESITVAQTDFEPGAFWREMRRALRYGSGRLQARRGKGSRRRIVRLRRDEDHVILTGVSKTRIGDVILRLIALDAGSRAPALDTFLADLRLPAAEAARIRSAVDGARSPSRLADVLRDARQRSAAARHSDIVAKLGRRERFRLDGLAPAPFAAVLSAMGIGGTEEPFGRVLVAARAIRDHEDAAASLVETAGIPRLRTIEFTPALVESWIARARTPLAIVHAMVAARAIGRPAADVVALGERLASSVESAGPLFAALLRWTHRWALRDEAWRVAPPAFFLAAIWGHADRVLDAVLGARLAPEPLRRSLERSDPELSGADLLRLQPAGPPDVAWPAWITPAALVHHALGAVFGQDDLRTELGDVLTDRLGELQLSRTAGVVGPEARLLLRRETWPDAMGSFLASSPVTFDEGEFDRAGIRAALVEGALAAIENDPEDRGAWLQLGAFGSGGLETSHAERLRLLVCQDAARLVRLVAAGADQALWRTVIQPIAWVDPTEATRLARELALTCRRLDEARPAGAPHGVALDGAAEELVELASIIAACAGERRGEKFADLLDGYSTAWPALRPILHHTLGDLTARTPSARSGDLWRIQDVLGSR